MYLGRCYRLSLVTEQETDLILKQGLFCLDRKLIDAGGTESAKKAFENYYSTKCLQRIEQRVKYFAPKVGVQATSVKVREMGYRWASCNKDNALAFHWKCMMAPAKIIDYIIVHELCHIHHRNHTDTFWNEVDKVMPDFREGKDWLRNNGANLDL